MQLTGIHNNVQDARNSVGVHDGVFVKNVIVHNVRECRKDEREKNVHPQTLNTASEYAYDIQM